MAIAEHTSSTSVEDLPRLTASPPSVAFWGLCGPDEVTPPEVPPPVSVASERFIKRIERLAKRDDEGLTQPSRKVLALLKSLHPDEDRDDLIEVALMLEASAGSTDQFLRAVSNPEVLPTDHGDLVVLDYLVLTPMLSRDLDNPRPFLRLGTRSQGNGYSYTSPVLREYDEKGLRTLEVKDTSHFDELHQAHRQALGFTGQVRDPRDRLDLERGARLGILKPATAAPVRIVDRATGAIALQLGLVDANRRLTFTERIFDAVMPGFAFGTFSRRHLFDGEGLTFRRFTAEDAHEARETLADLFADLDAPGDTGDSEADERRVRQWAKQIDDNDPLGAAVLRNRVMRCRVAVGLDPASALATNDPMTVAVGAYRDQLHLPDLQDVQWDKRATEAMVAHDLLGKSLHHDSVVPPRIAGRDDSDSATPWQESVLFHPTAVAWHVPGIRSTHHPEVAREVLAVDDDLRLCADEVVALDPGLPPAVRGEATEQRPPNTLDLVLATIATLVCRAQPMTQVISDTLAHHRMTNRPKPRGQLAAAVLGPLLRLPAEGPDTARAYAALSRSAQHGLVYKLDEAEDPLGDGLRWVDLIGTDWFDVVERAREERAGHGSSGGDKAFGPAQILLALAAAVSMEVSPAVVFGDQGPSPHQLTLSGLGGQRGRYKGDPLAVLLNLTTSEDGITQLWELIVAAIADESARPARSTRWADEAADGRMYGPFLTEVDVRDKPWGHGDGAGTTSGGGHTIRLGAAAFVESIFKRIADSLERHAAELEPIVDQDGRDAVDPELDPDVDDFGGRPTEAYFVDGVDQTVADRITRATSDIEKAAIQGKVVRETAFRSGGSR